MQKMVQSDTILSILPVVCSGKLSLAWFIYNAKVIIAILNFDSAYTIILKAYML